VKISGFKYFT
jgi:hypothetical protein